MSMSIWPVTPDFAAEVGDVDLSQPLGEEQIGQIKEAFWKYAVLVFPDQDLTQEQHLRFARYFGPLEETIVAYRSDAKLRVRKDLSDVSNLDEGDRIWDGSDRMRFYQQGNRLWHTDSSFRRVPARVSLLYARSVPPVGGQTEFADERAAYDALDEERKKAIEDLVVEHHYFTSRAKIGFHDFSDEEREAMPPVPQVLVRYLPESGRRCLYLASHATRVVGMSDEAGRELIDELTAHAIQRQFVYSHRWRARDLVMWDNRCTMHRGRDFDDLRWPRDLQRATVAEPANSTELPRVG